MIIKKEFKQDKISCTELQLNLLFNYPQRQLNDTEVRILAYIHVYQSEAELKLLEDKVMLTQQSLNNYFSSLRKKKLLTGFKQNKPTKLIPQLNPALKLFDSKDLEIQIKFIDNEN